MTKVNIEDIEQGTTCDDYIASSVGSEDDDVVSNAGSDNSYESVRVRSSSPPALPPRLPPKASGTEITEMTFGVNNENALCNIGLTDNDTDEETPGHMPLHYSYTPSEGSSSPQDQAGLLFETMSFESAGQYQEGTERKPDDADGMYGCLPSVYHVLPSIPNKTDDMSSTEEGEVIESNTNLGTFSNNITDEVNK